MLLIFNNIEQDSQLEKRTKQFGYKEWIPLVGLYFVTRNILKGEESHVYKLIWSINGLYHGFVSVMPIVCTISQIAERYF